MSLQSRLSSLISAIGADIKSLQTQINNLSSAGGTVKTAARTADHAGVLTSTALVDAGMSLAVDANSRYLATAVLYLTGNQTADNRTAIVGPTGATAKLSVLGVAPTSTATAFPIATSLLNTVVNLATAVLSGNISTTVPTAVIWTGIITVGATAGSVSVQYAQAASSALNATVMKDGSYLSLQKLV